jgi:TonB-dependent receptor
VDFSNTVRSTFKVGGKVYQTARSNATTELFCSESINDSYGAIKNIIPGVTLSPTRPLYFNDVWNQNYLSQRGKYFLNGSYPFSAAFSGLMDQVMLLAPAGWAHSEYEPGEWDRTWDGTETFGAGYAMGTFEIGPQLNLIAGVRYEHYNMNYSANNTYVTHEVYGDGLKLDTLNTVNRNDDDFFPNAQLRYKINEWSDIRVAFSKGISRPDYTAIIPETYFAPGADAHAGNAQLKPDISTNYDIAWSVYNNQVGLFTIAPFYKEIDNIFYYNPIIYQDLSKYNVSFPDSAFWAKEGLQAPSPSMQISAYVNNPHPAYVRGIELDWQTNFWYLPGVLSAVVLDVNYTKAASNMLYQEEDNEYHNIDTVINGHRQTIQQWYVVDTTRNGRLLYQANDVVNVALGIDYKGFSGRLSFNMQGNVITNVGLSDQEDQYTGNIYKWDFLLQQKLPLEGLSLSLSGVNIFHNPIYTYQYLRRVNASAPLVKNVVSVDYSPSLFELNLRYSL